MKISKAASSLIHISQEEKPTRIEVPIFRYSQPEPMWVSMVRVSIHDWVVIKQSRGCQVVVDLGHGNYYCTHFFMQPAPSMTTLTNITQPMMTRCLNILAPPVKFSMSLTSSQSSITVCRFIGAKSSNMVLSGGWAPQWPRAASNTTGSRAWRRLKNTGLEVIIPLLSGTCYMVDITLQTNLAVGAIRLSGLPGILKCSDMLLSKST